METADATQAVECAVRVEAPPAVVFEYFTDHEKLCRWFTDAAKGEARPGEPFRWVGGAYVAAGSFVEVSPPRRLVVTFGWEEGSPVTAGSTRVEIDLEPDGDATTVRLRHLDLPDDERERHRQGWEHFLARLAIAGAGGDPGPNVMEG